MKKILFLLFLFSSTQSQTLNELHTPENVRKFADHLFSERDYLRSVFEYERLPDNDTVQFKIAIAYQIIEGYDIALEKLSRIKPVSVFYEESQREYYKTLLLSGRYEDLQMKLKTNEDIEYQKLLYLSYFFTPDKFPGEQDFLTPFPAAEQEKLRYFYNQRREPPYKSPLLAGTMSALIPGSGKIYLGEIGDGITALLANSLLAFLSYDNFSHNHKFRGWLFAGLGFFFYAGNIYGSAAAAQIYNSKIDYQYNSSLNDYLNNKNYFLPENELIK